MFPVPILGDFIPVAATVCFAPTELSVPQNWRKRPTLSSASPHPFESMESGFLAMHHAKRIRLGSMKYGLSATTQIRMRHSPLGLRLLNLNSIP